MWIPHPDRLFRRLLAPALLLAAGPAPGQTPAPTPRPFFMATPRPAGGPAGASPWPFARPGTTPAPTPLTAAPPPRDSPPLVEKKFEQLSDQKLSADGRLALTINPDKWRHAETDNFILHYRRVTEAQKVAREVEYSLWYVATALGAGRERYSRKSHVYIFEDKDEWKEYLEKTDSSMKWSASYAHGDELFLNVRGAGNSGTGSFDFHTLAHEATHAVVARLYHGRGWPLWLNEGFAEYMAGASQAARRGLSPRHYERTLRFAELPVERLFTVGEYPADETARAQLYQSAEKFVRFFMTELPKERGLQYVEAITSGADPKTALLQQNGDRFRDWPDFQRKYERFAK